MSLKKITSQVALLETTKLDLVSILSMEQHPENRARETIKLVKQITFEKYNAHRLWLEVMERNDRAHSLYLSEGFKEEGIHRESYKQGDIFASLRVMSILKHEYSVNA